MAGVKYLFEFGIGIIAFGAIWRLAEDVINTYIKQYAVRNNWYWLADLEWHMLPWICLIGGAIMLIASGVAVVRSRGVQVE